MACTIIVLVDILRALVYYGPLWGCSDEALRLLTCFIGAWGCLTVFQAAVALHNIKDPSLPADFVAIGDKILGLGSSVGVKLSEEGAVITGSTTMGESLDSLRQCGIPEEELTSMITEGALREQEAGKACLEVLERLVNNL